MISKDTKEAKVTFIYEKKTIQILGSVEEELSKFFERFITKLNANSSINDYEFYYEGHKLTNITNIQNSDIIKDKKEFAISAFKKTKKIKCPKCICNDCILKISAICFSNSLNLNQIPYFCLKYSYKAFFSKFLR